MNFIKVNKLYISQIKKGDRLFHFTKTDPATSEDYILYTISKIKGDTITMMNIFDKKEKQLLITVDNLLQNDCWFYNPEFELA